MRLILNLYQMGQNFPGFDFFLQIIVKKGEEEGAKEDRAREGVVSHEHFFIDEMKKVENGALKRSVHHLINVGEEDGKETEMFQLFEKGCGRTERQNIGNLFGDAGRGTFMDFFAEVEKSLIGTLFHLKPKAGTEFDETQHPHRILFETDIRVADRLEDVPFQITKPFHIVDDFFRFGVVKKTVEGEI